METEKSPETLEFRLWLQEELLRRIKKNPKYSLRAFADFLGMNSGTLSQILSGKRRLSEKNVKNLALKIGLNPSETEKFVQAAYQKSMTDSSVHLTQLTLDAFQVIADWYHYAILELVYLEGFKPDLKWISQALGISVAEARAATERLIRLEYLEIDAKGRWHNRSGSITTVGNDFTAAAFRKLQKQILEQAVDALENIPYEERDNSSLTISIASEDLAALKQKIKIFRREILAFVDRRNKKNDLYHLCIALYPILKRRKDL